MTYPTGGRTKAKSHCTVCSNKAVPDAPSIAASACDLDSYSTNA